MPARRWIILAVLFAARAATGFQFQSVGSATNLLMNDLAIGYEHEGQLDKARKAYEKALELDPNNSQIRQNYELFKEINDRTAQKEK